MFKRSILTTQRRFSSTFKKIVYENIEKRRSQKVGPEILNFKEVELLCKELQNPKNHENEFLLHQFSNRIVPGVDDTSRLKANFLLDLCLDNLNSPIINKRHAVKLLGTMQGGYNVEALVKLLQLEELNKYAAEELKEIILIFEYFYDIEKLAKKGNIYATDIIQSWANAEWFINKKPVKDKITLTAFKVTGEINTDDLSPAQDAWSRPDIPLHALSMLKNPRDGIIPDEEYIMGPITTINNLKEKGYPIAFVGDVVGTGSSRKSATNSILWHFGNNIDYIPNKRSGGYCIGNKIAPIFFNTMEDSGALPIEMPVENINMGDVIDIYPYEGITKMNKTQNII